MIDYSGLLQNELNDRFVTACCNGNFEAVRCLLASHDLSKHANIHSNNDIGFLWACSKGYINIVKYLLTSHELKEHISIHSNNDYCFKLMCNISNSEIINFLIFDIGIEKTDEINEFLKDEKYQEVKNLFQIRDLNKQLESELNFSYNNKKNKI